MALFPPLIDEHGSQYFKEFNKARIICVPLVIMELVFDSDTSTNKVIYAHIVSAYSKPMLINFISGTISESDSSVPVCCDCVSPEVETRSGDSFLISSLSYYFGGFPVDIRGNLENTTC